MELYCIKSDHRKSHCTFISLSLGFISLPQLLVKFSKVPCDMRQKSVERGPKGAWKMISRASSMYKPTDRSKAEMKFSAVWGKMCRERFDVEETFRQMADVNVLQMEEERPKQPPKECVIADQGIPAALGFHVVSAAGYLPQSQGVAVLLWWLQNPWCLSVADYLGEEESQKNMECLQLGLM